ncbi:S41 family peptidase [Janthinobacterium agaricidamnosum]|nr:S41 family peptidase [Janthinobacterium agaricidamnosum]
MSSQGFESVQLDLDTSTAYIRSKGSWKASDGTFGAAAGAMALAANAKNVIIDVRGNPGGDGEIGRFLASYFYQTGDEQYYLYGYTKNNAYSQQEWTYAFVPGRRLPDARLYILVDKDTGSATEGFAYAMQHLKRATVIGQVTAGAGIAGELEKLGSKLSMFLPTKMIVAPNTNEGWEGKGVQPDVVTAPGEERAAAMALIAGHP